MPSINEIQSNFAQILLALQRSLSDDINGGSLEVALRSNIQNVESKLSLIIRARESYIALNFNDNAELAMRLNAIIDLILGTKTENTMAIDDARYQAAVANVKELRTASDKLKAQIEELKSKLAAEELDDAALMAQVNSVEEKANTLIGLVLDPMPSAETPVPAPENPAPVDVPSTPDPAAPEVPPVI